MSSLFTDPFIPDFAVLLVRVFVGVCFVIHALGKLGVVGSGSMPGFVAWLKSMGIPQPELQARMAMLSELIGGTMITLGMFTRVGAVLCFVTMCVAALIGHKGGGYLITNNPPGNEYAINLAVICVALFLLGPGQFSIDALLF